MTLTELWNLVGVADTALMIVAALVVVAGILGMMTSILASLNERRREMAILRSVGARAHHVFSSDGRRGGFARARGNPGRRVPLPCAGRCWAPSIAQRLGIDIAIRPPTLQDIQILVAVISSALLVGTLPAFRAYRNSLSDGLQLRT